MTPSRGGAGAGSKLLGGQLGVTSPKSGLSREVSAIDGGEAAGVAAVKIEGRQRSVAYVDKVVRVWREALDTCRRSPEAYTPRSEWMATLASLSEGAQTTLGAYDRPWQ